MPELVTGVSSAALVASPDLALGTLVGSCCFNLSILALMDVLHPRTPVLSQASPRHMISAGWGILLMSIVGVSILAGDKISRLALGWFGIPSIVILAVYLTGMWRQFRYERSHQLIAQAASQNYREIPRRIVYIRFALAAAAVIAAGIWLSFIGDEIATTTSLGSTFVGTLFLAISTSMPELVVCVAALRLDAIDMAIADVLGANMLDLANIAWVDIAYRQGPILCSVSSSHLITATVTVIMSLLVIAGLRFRQKRKTFLIISWYAVALIGLYVFAAYALFTSNAGL